MGRVNRFLFIAVVLFTFFFSLSATGQQKKFTISGTVTDAATGEVLISVPVSVPGIASPALSNSYGFYSLSLPEGSYEVAVLHLGYETRRETVELHGDVRLNLALQPAPSRIDEVVVLSEGERLGVSRSEMSVATLSSATIKKIPTLMGETDPLKALQLLPGVQATAEGSSGFSVRGGGYDQNLVVLDEATVYSVSHLMGFFSVFNNDALKDIKLYKGDIPAAFGGRLSSLVEIHSRDGNSRKFAGTGGIGTISSRLTLEGPIVKDRATFLVSGRRTYADLFLKMASDKNLRQSQLYFYDLNGKLSWRLGENDRLYAAGYMGRDYAAASVFGMSFSNRTGSLRWNHIFSPRFFSNITLVASSYRYALKYDASERMAVEWLSRINDFGLKADMSYHFSPAHTMRFGYQGTYHDFSPGEGGGVGDNSAYGRISTTKQYAFEQGIYASGESTFGAVVLKYGLRLSLMSNITNGDTIDYMSNYQVVRREVAPPGRFYNTQAVPEPRFGATWRIDPSNSLKASYTRAAQYIQLASNSTAGSPLDVWFQASQNVRPQISDQYALGYFRAFGRNMYEASVEVYYKRMQHVIDFRDHAQLLVNDHLEQELRFGRGQGYGVELMLSKNSGRLSGWVSYALSKSRRQINMVNDGEWYRSPYDKPVNISVVVNYELSPRWSLSANWVYASGMPVTYPTGRFQIENTYVPVYSRRNEYRYPDYHRLDLGATWVVSKPASRLHSELNFSLYNAYGRKNPWTIMFKQEAVQPDVSYAEMLYLFTFVPSVTWNFKF